MRVLLIKTSSIGDVVHTFPAVTDAAKARPGLRFDWVVEEAMADLVALHPAVDRVLPVALRRWRRAPVRSWRAGEIARFRSALAGARYELALDAQGLMKSAVLAWLADAPRHGFDRASIREPLAALAYRHRHAVPPDLHAVDRLRRLFAQTLDYPRPETPPDYGLDRRRLGLTDAPPAYVAFLHGTAWTTKQWPVARWRALAADLGAAGRQVRLPFAGATDRARALAIADGFAHVHPIETPDLMAAARLVAEARAAVAVDTGLAHLAAAFAVPTLALYGPTSAALTGTAGPGQRHRIATLPCAPCRKRVCRIVAAPTDDPPCMAGMSVAAADLAALEADR